MTNPKSKSFRNKKLHETPTSQTEATEDVNSTPPNTDCSTPRPSGAIMQAKLLSSYEAPRGSATYNAHVSHLIDHGVNSELPEGSRLHVAQSIYLPCEEPSLFDEPTSTFYTSAMKYVYDNLPDKGIQIPSPFGHRRMTYADYVASGRSLKFIEEYISRYVSGYYGNTHTSTSYASMQTSRFRDDAKDIIRRCCNASAEDAVIFCGSGSTAAIHKLIAVLGMNTPSEAQNTVVFIGPYEHHSNILPWKETGAEIVRIKEGEHGEFGVEQLAPELKKYSSDGRRKVGTFSACSNVTGLVVDTDEISALMHKHDAVVFWDYAGGAPYLKIDMNSPHNPAAFKDAVFCSPHKFAGGPGTPGLLIAKKTLFTNTVPHAGGGGTVVYVTRHKHTYTSNVEAREEGGTPAIIESIRAGLVFQLKEVIGCDMIHKREEHLAQKGIESLSKNSNIMLLGSKVLPRIPILSFCVKHPASKKLVHHNFIALLLSDLFGIQARGGCACAGPYAQDLLGIADEVANGIMAFLDTNVRHHSKVKSQNCTDMIPMDKAVKEAESLAIMKPGFVRLNLAYFVPDEEIDFILTAVHMVANEGWKLLPQYKCDLVEGGFKHRIGKNEMMSLHDICYSNASRQQQVHGFVNTTVRPKRQQAFSDILKAAQEIFDSAQKVGIELYPTDEETIKAVIPECLIPLIWFVDTSKAFTLLTSRPLELSKSRVQSMPFLPRAKSGPNAGPKNSRAMTFYPQIHVAYPDDSKIDLAEMMEIRKRSCCQVM